MIVKLTDAGDYFVIAENNGQTLAGPFPSHAAAWRWIDRQSGQPISRAEQTADWIAHKILTGGDA